MAINCDSFVVQKNVNEIVRFGENQLCPSPCHAFEFNWGNGKSINSLS
jgi:hypothetical protein